MQFEIPTTVNIDTVGLARMNRRTLQELHRQIGIILSKGQDIPAEVAAKPVHEIGLDVRTLNCLVVNDILTVGDLCAKTDRELMHIRNFGRMCLQDVKRQLAELNLSIIVTDAGLEKRT